MHGGNKSGRGHKGERQRGNRPRLGFEGGQTPFYLLIPKYGYNEGHRWGKNYTAHLLDFLSNVKEHVGCTHGMILFHNLIDLNITVCVFVFSRRQQYPPLTLRRLQYLIDLGRVDPSQPIDLTQLVNGRGVTIQPLKRDYGVHLVEEVSALLLLLLSS